MRHTLEAEVRLLRWGESSTAGRTITLELPPGDGEVHPFRGFPTGHSHGQRFRLFFEPIGDDEKPIESHAKATLRAALVATDEADRAEERRSQLSVVGKERYAQMLPEQQAVADAGMLAQDPQFIAWARLVKGGRVYNESDAVQYIRSWCGVSTRREIATNSHAYEAFIRLKTVFEVDVGRLPERRA
jgi:hypothetical protein